MKLFLGFISLLFLSGCVNKHGVSLKYYSDCKEYYDVQGFYHKECGEDDIFTYKGIGKSLDYIVGEDKKESSKNVRSIK